MQPPKPLLEFKAYISPRTSPQFVIVRVHRSRKHLLAWRNRGKGTKSDRATAYFRPANLIEVITCQGGRQKLEPQACVGDMNFFPGKLSQAVIAHECLHAVMCWAVREGCLPGTAARDWPDGEELCAEAIGALVGQVTVGTNRYTVWRKSLRAAIFAERDYYE